MHAPPDAGPPPSRNAILVRPGQFEPERHFYTRVLNAQIHPLVRFFLGLSNDRIIDRYCHMNPMVDRAALAGLLKRRPRYLHWAGCDLMHVTTADGRRQMVVIETNSCPSGQKSMPLFEEMQEQGGYRALVERAFSHLLHTRRMPVGELGVIYDKNEMEASGYAAALADVTASPVHLARFDADDPNPPVRFDDGLMYIRAEDGAWVPIRAALRYVTQRPWTRIPLHARTVILNPVVVCLAGGRNKLVAATAYELFNQRYKPAGLRIITPKTIRDVTLSEVPAWVNNLGGRAVVKVPYSNAGQGVYTITNPAELAQFMADRHRYDRFVVQSLIGNYRWSSNTGRGTFYHVGTIPSRRGEIFVADLRMMVCAGDAGFSPLAIYARRARLPLLDTLDPGVSSWDMLGTNLSIRREDGGWDTESGRLMLMDRKDFNSLGLGIDDLIEAMVQTALSTIAIDEMADNLHTRRGRFRLRLFQTLNEDPALIDELLP